MKMMIRNNHMGLYSVRPAKNSISPVVRKSRMSFSFETVGSRISGGVKVSTIEDLKDPLSLWCRAHPEYGWDFERFTSCLTTRRNNPPINDTYWRCEGNETENGTVSKRSRILLLGIPSALALKQAKIHGSASTPGSAWNNVISSSVNSSHNHLPKSARMIVPIFPEEKSRKRSSFRVSRLVDTVILKVLIDPRLGKFNFLERLKRPISLVKPIPMTFSPRSLTVFSKGEALNISLC